ncbi:MAG: tetratricopeptide repeat protein [Thermoleophilia bacterium]|nr:tetratricopeptide repeat protein [Thermoleophilia bacterium]
MLLDRKRINKWAKWVALGLAIVFGFSFVAMGVGSGTNLNWGDLWQSLGGSNGQASPQTAEDRIDEYESMLATNPQDVTALLGLANEYQQLDQPATAAQYLEKAAAVKTDDVDIRMSLAAIYLAPDTRDYQAAVRVLNEATSLDPANAQAFLQLGAAQRGAGNIDGAILAWNKYLQLAPDGEMAGTVKDELAQMTASKTTTTTSATSTTSTTPTTGSTGDTTPATTQ